MGLCEIVNSAGHFRDLDLFRWVRRVPIGQKSFFFNLPPLALKARHLSGLICLLLGCLGVPEQTLDGLSYVLGLD